MAVVMTVDITREMIIIFSNSSNDITAEINDNA